MEAEIIHWIRNRLPGEPRLQLGPGDDAALIDWPNSQACLMSVDTMVEGLDFTRKTATLEAIGYKALAINLSDLAAMASLPVAATVSLVLPAVDSLATCQGLFEGMLPLAQHHQVALAGGDISIWEGPLVITVNVLGEPGPNGTWARDGAQPGDVILVTGDLGGSLLGNHLDFSPRVCEALILNQSYQIKAAMDISDGLALDLSTLARENQVKAVLQPAQIPIAAAAYQSASESPAGLTPLDHALQDGEDFELLLVTTPQEGDRLLRDQPLSCGIRCIGNFAVGEGLWAETAHGDHERVPAIGYEHGATR